MTALDPATHWAIWILMQAHRTAEESARRILVHAAAHLSIPR